MYVYCRKLVLDDEGSITSVDFYKVPKGVFINTPEEKRLPKMTLVSGDLISKIYIVTSKVSVKDLEFIKKLINSYVKQIFEENDEEGKIQRLTQIIYRVESLIYGVDFEEEYVETPIRRICEKEIVNYSTLENVLGELLSINNKLKKLL